MRRPEQVTQALKTGSNTVALTKGTIADVPDRERVQYYLQEQKFKNPELDIHYKFGVDISPESAGSVNDIVNGLSHSQVEKIMSRIRGLKKYGRATEHMVVIETPPILKRFAARYEDPASVILPMLSRDWDGKVTAMTIGKSVMAIQMNNRAFKRVLQMFPDGKGNFLQSKIWQYLIASWGM